MKRKRRRLNIRAVFLLAVLLAAAGFSAWRFASRESGQGEKEETAFTCCRLTHEESEELIRSEEFTDTVTIQDVLFYGESLNLYQESYELGKKDPLIGSAFVLRNLCDDSMFSPLNTGTVDAMIDLSLLPEGIYSVSVYDGNGEKRLIMNEKYEETLTLVRRDGRQLRARIIANAFMLGHDPLESNRLYLIIEEAEDDGSYDIVLDPSYGYDTGSYVEKGGTYNGITMSEETYAFAKDLQKILEEHGLKVLITRKNSYTLTEAFGEKGRIAKAYESGAKYLFVIDMSTAQASDNEGLLITCSAYASGSLAHDLADVLLENTEIPASGLSDPAGSGITRSIRNSSGYDGNFIIRESGGKALGAGSANEKSEENASFAYDNIRGMEALSINYVYLNNRSDAERYRENRDIYVQETANAILKSLGVIE